MSKMIQFADHQEPTLQSGTHEWTFTQTAGIKKDKTPFEKKVKILVAGERFSLSPQDYNSVYPPEMGNGDYGLTLPHVVLNRRTLPWERTAGDKKAPWLALLLIHKDENPPQVVNGKVKDLKNQNLIVSHNFKDLRKEMEETEETRCSYVDIPVELFVKIHPSYEELPLLTHCRKIELEDGKKLEHAVVVSNRYAKKETTSYLFLVSLENIDLSKVKDFKTIRLIVFKSWQFSAKDEGSHYFQKVLENLNVSPLTLPTEQIAQETKTILQKGYVPMVHHLRKGGQTVSCYRGPLVPYQVSERPKDAKSYRCSDAANRFDKTTGLFDVSYGAAWQLGQVLALKSPHFSIPFYNWGKNIAANKFTQKEFKNLVESISGTHLVNVVKTDSVKDEKEVSGEVHSMLDWIASLRLLYDIPFSYLVPDEHMLPSESIRFFYLDPQWVSAMLDGAFSIGRDPTEDVQDDMHFLRDKSLEHLKAIYHSTEINPSILTGFLLRSKAVSFGPRLIIEAKGKNADEKWLAPIRTERFTDEILFCLFPCEIQKITIHEPPERLHFGIEETEQQLSIKQLAGKDNSAEFALKRVKGVVNVEFNRSN